MHRNRKANAPQTERYLARFRKSYHPTTDFEFDGNPEWFYNPGYTVKGPSWNNEGVPFTTRFKYDVDVPAGNLWYHDHALDLTCLNVNAGMARFFFVRDDEDTGKPDNPLRLPAFPYEMAYAIQDRMFKNNGRLFYPAFPGDPFYDDFINPRTIGQYSSGNPNPVTNTRKVALFEGKDEFGRLQPLLGTVHPTRPKRFGSQATPHTWANPDTELPILNTTERWEIYNFTGDAHPVHLHLVNFEILGRAEIDFHSDEGDPGQDVVMHNGELGVAPIITKLSIGSRVNLGPGDGYVENAPKDMVMALPGQVTVIKATFDKLGKYVRHCHILSHEAHEMMRVLRVM